MCLLGEMWKSKRLPFDFALPTSILSTMSTYSLKDFICI